ncbi:hypothetical protein CC1G_14894 [Coprinopsis cinerea okayama7|uniref:Uncharacterized protein n=1 Tax=Coprinopsis cinerea (strain Okayama-7 / 130 / ATCC MYA-4618 / FGSC 9003) TaxID=240176 RepID=D6RNK7_COPC7|nr:hypothetical protein CC1G_14894 [Coprinopsis cinerea okayama7\|eukprot:XP_002910917.1 hypothetical protein CC1G_14894 [Coprinopsis cinerea okayama7\
MSTLALCCRPGSRIIEIEVRRHRPPCIRNHRLLCVQSNLKLVRTTGRDVTQIRVAGPRPWARVGNDLGCLWRASLLNRMRSLLANGGVVPTWTVIEAGVASEDPTRNEHCSCRNENALDLKTVLPLELQDVLLLLRHSRLLRGRRDSLATYVLPGPYAPRVGV